ncbi:Variant-specific surface protein, partial [Giardia duodenalis]
VGGCCNVGVAPGSSVCREARGGACVRYKEEHSVDGGRHRMQGSRVRDDAKRATAAATCTEDKSTQTTGKCNTCGVRIGDGEYCAKCSKTDDRLIDGICVADNTDTKCKAKSVADGTCESCGAGYFLHKGGCYSTEVDKPGRTLCTAAGDGVCTQGADGYFAVPGAAKTGESVVACGDTTGVTVSTNNKYIGVDSCSKCDAPSPITGATSLMTAAATCTECTVPKIVKTVIASEKSVTSCIEPAECKDGFFVETTTNDGTSSKVCIACGDENCDVCAASGAKKCSKCKTDGTKIYLQKEADSQTGTCIEKASCTGTNYIDEEAKTCSACASAGTTDCTTCEKGADGVVVCKTCTTDRKTVFGLNKKSCVSQCPTNSSKQNDMCVCNDGFTPNEDSSACVAASSCKTPHCQTCTGEGQENEACTACISNYYLTPTGQCIADCATLSGYYGDTASKTCKPCSPECASCTAAGADKCLSCPVGKVLKYTDETNPSDGSCVDECRANTGGCDTCGAVIGGSRYCSKCGDASQAPLNGDCAANTARIQFCTQVDGGTCTQCANGYFLLDGGCYQTTRQPGSQVCTTTDSNGQCSQCANTLSPSNGVCPACPAGCSKCSNTNTCTECLAGYYKTSANICVKCTENSTNGGNTITGVKDCVSCTPPTGNSGTVTCYVTRTPTVDPADPSVNKGGLSSGAIAGISVAVIAVVGGLVGFLCWWFICRGKA